MRRYSVPRISFINKMDRPGANPWRVINQIRQKLKIGAAAVQVPIGVEDDLRGVVDLVRWKAVYNQGEKGNQVVESDEIPAEVLELAKEKRRELVEQLAEVDDEIGELLIMDEDPTTAQLADAIRRATISLKFTPVFLGSAIKNTAVQPMLDGVCAYLPTPAESKVTAHDTSLPVSAPSVELTPASEAPLVALAFKLEEGRFGQLTYMRVYQGTMRKGQFIFHARTGKKVKVPRLVRMHSNEMEVSCEPYLSCFRRLILFLSRISKRLAPARSVLSSVSIVLPATPSPMELLPSRWYVFFLGCLRASKLTLV